MSLPIVFDLWDSIRMPNGSGTSSIYTTGAEVGTREVLPCQLSSKAYYYNALPDKHTGLPINQPCWLAGCLELSRATNSDVHGLRYSCHKAYGMFADAVAAGAVGNCSDHSCGLMVSSG